MTAEITRKKQKTVSFVFISFNLMQFEIIMDGIN